MKTDNNRIHNLRQYVQGIMNKEDGKALYEKYKSHIETVIPQEVFEVFNYFLEERVQPKEILIYLDKIINVLYKSLISYSWKRPEKNSFMDFLIQENRALVYKLEGIKEVIKISDLQQKVSELLPRLHELQEFEQHYLKKENILFPYLEKKMNRFNGLAIMWALHDETRELLKNIIKYIEAGELDAAELNIMLGSLFFAMHGLIKKEELILFPAASEVIEAEEWLEMQKQSLEYGFPFIQRPMPLDDRESIADKANELFDNVTEGYQFKTETGVLDFEQALMIFNALPVDMTFVDENNKVRFFTRPKDRIFPRSAAIIGRDVEKCHPPESVHVVNEIINAFRAGQRDNASFWINIKDKKILIQYFALRDDKGNYRGVLEVSQDITEISQLQGERRLLQWQ